MMILQYPLFDGKHNLINGGSWVSCGNLATQKSRYGFRRHFYQHAGFRYIESNYEEKVVIRLLHELIVSFHNTVILAGERID